MALHSIDPIFEGDRIDTAAAVVANLIFNANRGPDVRATTPDDWIPDYFARFHPAQSAEDVTAGLDSWFERIGGE